MRLKLLVVFLLLSLSVFLVGCSKSDVPDVVPDSLSMSNSENKVIVYYFWGVGCPRCDLQKPFMDYLANKYSNIEIVSLEVHEDSENYGFFEELSFAYGELAGGVPATFIGESYPVFGFGDVDTTGRLIEDKIIFCLENTCLNPLDVLYEFKHGLENE